MRRTVQSLVLALLLAVAPSLRAQVQEEPAHPRARAPLTILQINDVYSTVPVDGVGGLARVAAIKKELVAQGRNPLLMIGGDFLSSSVASTVFKGEQMIAALNATGLDVATLGNHEFDFGVDLLIARMQQARWQWVVANIIDRQTNSLIAGASPYVIRTAGPLKVGIIGLCIVNESMTSPALRERLRMVDPIEAAARYIPEMRQAGADVIVALTHLNFADDRALAARFPDIDIIVGGHEHFPITAVEGRTLISKAGSEARFVARIDVNKRDQVPLERYFELVPVTSAIKDDPATAAVVEEWEARLGREMDVPVGSSRVTLEARDVRLRASEVNLGDLIADAMRQQAGTDVAIMNSGGIRGNREYPSGPLTRRMLVQMLPFNNTVCTIEVTGQQLLRALNHGVSRLPLASGQFPQVSGMTFRVLASAPAGDRVRDLRINGTPVDRTATYTLALPDYLFNGGDGYEMFSGSRVLVSQENAPLIVTALEKVVAAGEVGVTVEQRIRVEH